MTQDIITRAKYACIALLAGFMVTGAPDVGYARGLTTDGASFELGLAIDGLLGLSPVTDICGDFKGKACDEVGKVKDCKTKGSPPKYCKQECNSDKKWGSAYDCKDSPPSSGTAGEETNVLTTF